MGPGRFSPWNVFIHGITQHLSNGLQWGQGGLVPGIPLAFSCALLKASELQWGQGGLVPGIEVEKITWNEIDLLQWGQGGLVPGILSPPWYHFTKSCFNGAREV